MNDQAIYPDGLADMMPRGKPYRPSSGAEGAYFMECHCFQCAKDKAFQDGTGDSCPIAALTVALDVTDPDYPKEWVYGPDGQPTCTAYAAE